MAAGCRWPLWALVFGLVLSGCSNGGSLSLESHGLTLGDRSPLKGSCTISSGPLVLGGGYCVEFYGGDSTGEADCSSGGGTWSSADSCAAAMNGAGRCLIRFPFGTEAIYFADTVKGQALCLAAMGLWEPAK